MELKEQGFIEVRTATNASLIQILNMELGLGEAETIALSKEIRPDYTHCWTTQKLESMRGPLT